MIFDPEFWNFKTAQNNLNKYVKMQKNILSNMMKSEKLYHFWILRYSWFSALNFGISKLLKNSKKITKITKIIKNIILYLFLSLWFFKHQSIIIKHSALLIRMVAWVVCVLIYKDYTSYQNYYHLVNCRNKASVCPL